jgi:phosphoenolpyruvate carboxykinase (ATP)
MSIKQLESISKCLASTYRQRGPQLISEHISTPVGGTDYSGSDIGRKVIMVYHNLPPARYYEFAIHEPGTVISHTGALCSYSGAKTGRCPKDKRVVYDENSPSSKKIWWHNNNNSPNYKMDPESFIINRETALNYLNTRDRLFVVDAFAGWSKNHRIKVRLICERAYHALFIHNMLVRPTKEELVGFEPDFIIYNAGNFPSNRYSTYMTSSTSIDISLERKEVVILGTQYAGEMKKGIFSIMYYLMTLQNVLTLHSSVNVERKTNNTTIFFGLSGTGKTTLSADPNRCLIGDDEHCWTKDGLFNIEGGCYAKCINLDKEKEPEIYNAIRFGSILENVEVDPSTREVDFTNTSYTMNTRASYPIEYIKNAIIPCVSGHPNNIIFLTFDAFGVLPLVSKLNTEQALYHFISGYTAKIAGTEVGVKEPQATYSACYGLPFLLCHPLDYSYMLADKIKKHNVNVWLINTGWIMGKYGIGGSMRCPLKLTRQIVTDIQTDRLADIWLNAKDNCVKQLPVFGLEYLAKNGQDQYDGYLDPLIGWPNHKEYMKCLNQLAKLFVNNFKTYVDNGKDEEQVNDLVNIRDKGGPVIS